MIAYAPAASRAPYRILTRFYARAECEDFRAFIGECAPDLIIEPFERDRELLARLASPERVDLVLWRRRASETDLMAEIGAAAGATHAPLMVIVDRIEPAVICQAIRGGVAAIVPDSASIAQVVNVMRLAIAGGTHFPVEAGWLAGATAAPSARPDAPRMAAQLGLTPRQMQVLTQICLGMSNKGIARRLGMRETTVKAHVMQLMRRLEAENRTQVVLRATKMGFAAAPAAGE